MKFKGTTLDTPFEEIMQNYSREWEAVKAQVLSKKETKPKTFKEQLTEKADEFEKQIDMTEHIKAIKAKMEKVATQRKFYIYLIEPTGTKTLAFGSNEMSYNIFIPRCVLDWEYVQKFKEALKELGFDSNNGISSTSIKSEDDYDCWTIILEW